MIIAEILLSQNGDFIMTQSDRKTNLGRNFEAMILTSIPTVYDKDTGETASDQDSELWKRLKRRGYEGRLVIVLVNGVAAILYLGGINFRTNDQLLTCPSETVVEFRSIKIVLGERTCYAKYIVLK